MQNHNLGPVALKKKKENWCATVKSGNGFHYDRGVSRIEHCWGTKQKSNVACGGCGKIALTVEEN